MSHATRPMRNFGLLLASLVLAACGSDYEYPAADDSTPPPPTADVALKVLAADGPAVPDVAVAVYDDGGDALAADGITGADGSLSLDGLPAESELTLRLIADGYAAQVRRVQTGPDGTVLDVEALLAPRNPAQTFDAAAGGTFFETDGVTVTVDADAFVDADGNPVTGDVDVTMTPVDVSSEIGLELFPGPYAGERADGSETPVLVSQGTAEYVFSQGGEELQLAPDATAIIEIPIYVTTLPGGQPIAEGDTIPLWYLDEEAGIWVEEGEGTVVANAASPTGLALRGEVGHFSWWNCDVAWETGTLRVKVTLTEDGEPVPDQSSSSDQAQVYGSAPGYRLADTWVPLDTEVGGLFVPADESVCVFSTLLAGETVETSTLYGSEEVCVTVPEGAERLIELEIPVEPITAAVELPESATVGTAYGACGVRAGIEARGYSPPVEYRLLSGALPDGLELSADTGRIYGTPTPVLPGRNNPASFIVRVEDEIGRRFDTDAIDIEVFDELELEPAEVIPVLEAGQAYAVGNLFRPDGGRPDLSWRLAPGGNLPPGMELDEDNGVIQGTPGVIRAAGEPVLYYEADVRVQVEDANCATAQTSLTLPVMYPPRLSGEPASPVTAGEAFTFTPTNTGAPAEAWSVSRLPPWAAFDAAAGTLSGTPGASDVGTYTDIAITAENGIGDATSGLGSSTVTFDLEVVPAAPDLGGDPPTLRLAVGQALDYTPANGGGPADGWSVAGAPAWTSFDTATGNLTGVPATAGTFEGIVITATNASGESSLGPITIIVEAAASPPSLAATPPAGAVDAAYLFTVTNAGGAADSWSAAGTLPPGIAFADGTFTGTPTAAGDYTGITVTATNGAGTDSLTVAITVERGEQAPLVFADSGPVERPLGSAPFTNAATGGSGSGALMYASANPDVAAVDPATGEVAVGQAGETGITATKAGDANYLEASATYTVRVVDEAIVLAGTPAATVTAGSPYSFTPVVTQGVVETWEVQNPPAWAVFDGADGTLSGTPPADTVATYTDIVITGSNSAGKTDSIGPFSIEVTLAAPALTGAPPTTVDATRVPTQTLDYTPVNEGGPVDTWQIENLAPWAAFDTATGRLTGSPAETDAGTYPDIAITAINSAGQSGIGPFTIEVVVALPEVIYEAPGRAYLGAPYQLFPQNRGGRATEWSISGALPAWLSFDTDTGRLTGTPTADAYETVVEDLQITANNATGSDSGPVFDITVTAADLRSASAIGKAVDGQGGVVAVWRAPRTPDFRTVTPSAYNLYVADRPGLAEGTVAPLASATDVGEGPAAIGGLAPARIYYLSVGSEYTDATGTVEKRSPDIAFITAPLNDTGMKKFGDATDNGSSTPEAGFPGQDGLFGRDVVNPPPPQRQGFWYTGLDDTGAEDDRSPVCLRDEVTGLVWEVKTFDGGLRDQNNTYSYSDAEQYAADVNALNGGAGLCGRNDWRLPTVRELESILDYSRDRRTAFRTKFQNVQAGPYWTQTESVVTAGERWIVDFRSARTFSTPEAGDLAGGVYARLVSGTGPEPALAANGDGTVTDATTGLMWKVCREGLTWDPVTGDCAGEALSVNWQDALQRAVDVNSGLVGENLGYDDWRVPSASELAWLLDRSRAEPGLDTTVFPAGSGYRWTNTPGPDAIGQGASARAAWVTQGRTELDAKIASAGVRLVRGGTPPRRWFADRDGDGYGDEADTTYAVWPPEGYVDRGGDCNDGRDDIRPGASEAQDGIDNDCDGTVDEEDTPL